MSNESKALELAERLSRYKLNSGYAIHCHSAAAELRRQHAEIESLRAQLAARLPDGWKMVPVKPTKQMKTAGSRVQRYDKYNADEFMPDSVYAAMLSAAPSQGEPQEQRLTGNNEADRIINRLLSSDPDFQDCADAAAMIQREIKGPDSFATWREAAVHERMLRVKAEQQAPNDAAQSVDETNAVLASRYFDLLKVVEAYEKHGVTCQTFRHFVDAPCAECNCTLQQAPVQGEQLASAQIEEIGTFSGYVKWLPHHGAPMKVGDYLYSYPQQASEPMTADQIKEEWFDICPINAPSLNKVMMLARAVERHHKIGEKQ